MPTYDQPEETADLLTVSEVAKMLRVDDSTIRRWIKRRELRAIRFKSGGIRIPKAEVEAILHPPQDNVH